MGESIGDWVIDNLGWFLFVLFVGLIWFMLILAKSEGEARAKFMAECMSERKEYECTALWRAGEKHDQVVPVFVPLGR